MKIAFVSQPWNEVTPLARTGSVAIWTYEVARRLAPFYDVLIYSKGSRHKKKRAIKDRVRYRYVWTGPDARLQKVLRRTARFHKSKLPMFAASSYYLGYVLKVAWDLRSQHCDIVHVHNLSQFVPIIRALNPGVKIVLHMHCEWLTQLDHGTIARRLSKAHSILGCSDYITNRIRTSFPLFANKAATVRNGVDLDAFSGNETRRLRNPSQRILFVGRVSPEKGVHVLLEAFQKVLERCPHAELEIVGPLDRGDSEFVIGLIDDPRAAGLKAFLNADYLDHLQKEIGMDLMGRVSFAGFVPHGKLEKYYRDADLFVNPSFIDAFPLTIPEAMACGLPVVASDVGGTPEAVANRETGLLVEPGNAAALADVICGLLADRARLESMGKAARRRAVQHFSWERITDDLVAYYRSICG